MSHRIMLRSAVIDVPAGDPNSQRIFWAQALGASTRQGEHYPEYWILDGAAAALRVVVQELGQGQARVHLDIETDDVRAEVVRLVGLGATRVEEHDYWVILRDPGGMPLCVVPAASDNFEAQAHRVG